jgi:predicted RNase H-like HicB family nuclease
LPDDVRLLSAARNYAVVHLPQRRFPGVVVQGDSLNSLIGEVQEALAASDPQERGAILTAVVERLREVQAHYEMALERESIPLPYTQR